MTQDEARTALATWGRTGDDRFDPIEAAMALAVADDPSAPVEAARAAFAQLARSAATLAAETPDARRGDGPARARLVATVLGSHGYAGDRETYDDPANANLARVLVRRRGLPVALGLLWLGLGRHLGWKMHGVDFPGHFLLAVHWDEDGLLCDPFDAGRMQDKDLLRALKERFAGPGAAVTTADVAPMTDRAVVLRLANNLRVRRLDADALEPALSITEDMRLLAPEAPVLMYAAGELALRVGRPRAAISHLDRFLRTNPPDQHRRAASAMLDKARQSLN